MRVVLLLCALLPGAPLAGAQERKDDANKDAPRVTLIAPLGVNAGATATVRVRGLRLADATEVKFPGATQPVAATIRSKGKADLPQGVEAADAGDTQVEVELAVPKETPAGELPLVVVTPAGQTAPRALLVTDPATTTQEKEGNNGFRQAQALKPPTTIRGRIENAEDVDVFSFTARSGQTVVAEVSAARHGSLLDSLLTLYDAHGNVLATNDDAGSDADAAGNDEGDPKKDPEKVRAARACRDSVLRFRCPSDGTYYLSLLDANGRGGPTHGYQLGVKLDDATPPKE
jgi:hypothetical protein